MKTASLWLGLVATVEVLQQKQFEVLGQPALCACQPSTYVLTLDFAGSCENIQGITNGENGVLERACLVENRSSGLAVSPEESIPVSIDEIIISELNQSFDDLKTETYTRAFSDGETISYTSVLSGADPDEFTGTSLPRALQVSVQGLNDNGDTIVNIWAIIFTNDCEEFPVLEDGARIGWTVLSELTDPSADTCPLVERTEVPSAPTFLPSDFPSSMESDMPSDVTSDSPSDIRSNVPSPRIPETDIPVVAPTPAPVPLPTFAPVTDPDECPTKKGKGGKGMKGKSGMKGKGEIGEELSDDDFVGKGKGKGKKMSENGKGKEKDPCKDKKGMKTGKSGKGKGKGDSNNLRTLRNLLQ